jgi:hypothetical protein
MSQRDHATLVFCVLKAQRFGLANMLALMKKLIGITDPADIVSEEASDIIKRYQRFGEKERQDVASAFTYAKARLEIDHGEINTWKLEHKVAVANYVLKTAKEAYAHAPYSSSGVALVGLYLEAQTLRGNKAKRLVHLLDEWHRRAVISRQQAGNKLIDPG